MAVSSHPPLLPSVSQLSLGVTRISRDAWSETLLGSEGDSEYSANSSSMNEIQLVSPRIIPGPCHVNNKGCIDWGPQGLIAYGANLCIVVVDPKSCQPIQCMLKHKAVVKKVLWAPQEFGKLRLVSGDITGNLILWNVEDGSSEVMVQDEKKPILDLAWMPSPSSYRSDSPLLPPLAALHSPYALIIWDMNQGLRLWRKVFTDTLLSFDIDPFDPTRLAFQCPDCILFIDDFSISRIPSTNGRKFYISSPKISGDTEDSLRSKDRLKRLMRGLSVGEIKPRAEDTMTLTECLQLSYHRALRHHILLLYARDVLIIDLHINMTVGVIPIERTATPLIQFMSCRSRDVIFCLHESGVFAIKTRRQYVSQASKQEIPGTPYPPELEQKEVDQDLCVWYESRVQTEIMKQSKGLKILGLTACPINENRFGMLLSSGKLVLFDFEQEVDETPYSTKPKELHSLSDILPPSHYERSPLPGPALRLLVTGYLQSSSTQITTIRMCPPLTTRNMLHYSWHLAAGTASGNILLFNVATGLLEKQLNVHSLMSVRGIEWIGPHSFLSWAWTLSSNSPSSTLARNELMLTDTKGGQSVCIRRSEVEEPYVYIVKASPLRQYFILILKDGPFELWDLRRFQLLRIMPKKIPIVTALEWSPAGKIKKNKQKGETTGERTEEFERKYDVSSSDEISGSRKKSQELLYATTQEAQTPGGNIEDLLLPVKERVVFTDNDSNLYYFIVEGTTLKDGIRIPPEENARRVNYLALKNNHIVQAHIDGTLHVWDLKLKRSWIKDLGRRWIRNMMFAPGKDNLRLAVLCSDGVDVIDLTEDKPSSDCQLKFPRDVQNISHIAWASSDHPILLAEDGTLIVMDKTLQISTSPLQRYANFTSVGTPLFCLLNKRSLDSLLLFLCSERLQKIVPLDYLVSNIEDLKTVLDDVITEEDLIQMDTIDRYSLVSALLGDSKLNNLISVLKYYTSVHVTEHYTGYDGSSDVNMSNKKINLHPSIIPLESSADVFLDHYHYQKLELDRTSIHESKRGDYKHIQQVIQRLILLGETDRAVQLLLETQISNDNYYTDAIKACLVSTIQSTGAAQSTIKLVATNLIANERVWEGVQLLCLIGKGLDACKYLISYGMWYDAVWLSKSILSTSDMKDVIKKWAAHMNSTGDWYFSLLAYISLGQYETVMEILLEKKENVIAWLILNVCNEVDIQINGEVIEKLQAALSEQYKTCDIGVVDVLFSR